MRQAGMHERALRQRVTVVIATRNRSAELARTLDKLTALPGRPRIIVVDNASSDATARLVRERYPSPSVRLITLPTNQGAAARTLGARLADTPYVAFSDDDSWWSPGALVHAADLLDEHPRLGLIAARILVHSADTTDAPDFVNWQMARSPLATPRATPNQALPDQPPLDPTSAHEGTQERNAGHPLPGQPVLGFLACASIARREALLDIGGFAPFLGVGAEERLAAYDLRAAGWDLVYVHDIVAHHLPSRIRDVSARRAHTLRNDLLIDLLRRPWPVVRASARRLLAAAPHDPAARAAITAAARLAPTVIRQRRVLPERVEAEARTLESAGGFGVVPTR